MSMCFLESPRALCHCCLIANSYRSLCQCSTVNSNIDSSPWTLLPPSLLALFLGSVFGPGHSRENAVWQTWPKICERAQKSLSKSGGRRMNMLTCLLWQKKKELRAIKKCLSWKRNKGPSKSLFDKRIQKKKSPGHRKVLVSETKCKPLHAFKKGCVFETKTFGPTKKRFCHKVIPCGTSKRK